MTADTESKNGTSPTENTSAGETGVKVNNNKKPTKEEFRYLVTSFMLDIEKSLTRFPETKEGLNFKNYSKDLLEKQIQFVLDGKNKEVEKRYKYYVEYN